MRKKLFLKRITNQFRKLKNKKDGTIKKPRRFWHKLKLGIRMASVAYLSKNFGGISEFYTTDQAPISTVRNVVENDGKLFIDNEIGSSSAPNYSAKSTCLTIIGGSDRSIGPAGKAAGKLAQKNQASTTTIVPTAEAFGSQLGFAAHPGLLQNPNRGIFPRTPTVNPQKPGCGPGGPRSITVLSSKKGEQRKVYDEMSPTLSKISKKVRKDTETSKSLDKLERQLKDSEFHAGRGAEKLTGTKSVFYMRAGNKGRLFFKYSKEEKGAVEKLAECNKAREPEVIDQLKENYE